MRNLPVILYIVSDLVWCILRLTVLEVWRNNSVSNPWLCTQHTNRFYTAFEYALIVNLRQNWERWSVFSKQKKTLVIRGFWLCLLRLWAKRLPYMCTFSLRFQSCWMIHFPPLNNYYCSFIQICQKNVKMLITVENKHLKDVFKKTKSYWFNFLL